MLLSCIPLFLDFPSLVFLILNFFHSLFSSPFTCLYLFKALALPSHSSSEYFVSAPVSREQPFACLSSSLVACFINRLYFPSSFVVVVVVQILCSAALSCLPA